MNACATIREVVRVDDVRERLLARARQASWDRDLTLILVLRLLDAAIWMARRRGGSHSQG